MPDVNIDLDYFEHRKTKRTVGLLGRGADLLPIRMWIFCGKFHAEDGKLIGYSEQEIESACDWWGEKGKMVEAFLNVGWLESIDGGYQVHDWLEHQGHLKAYKIRAKVAADARWARAAYATSIPQALQNAPPSNATPSIVKDSTDQSCSRGVQGGRKPLPELGVKISKWFGRRESTPWSERELKALHAVIKLGTSDEDFALLEKRYLDKHPFTRKEILTLLNNWSGELDRAREGNKNGTHIENNGRNGRPTSGDLRNAQIIGSDDTLAAIQRDMQNPEPAPWDSP